MSGVPTLKTGHDVDLIQFDSQWIQSIFIVLNWAFLKHSKLDFESLSRSSALAYYIYFDFNLFSVLSSGNNVTELDMGLSDAYLPQCGANYCPASAPVSSGNTTDSDDDHDNFKTDITKIYTIAGIFLACSLAAAAIIAIFVDPLTRWIAHFNVL